METILSLGIIPAVVLLVAILIAIKTIKTLIVIVPPNQAAIITGRRRRISADKEVGYRTVIGGRTLRIPIIETIHHMSLETIPLEIQVTNAFSKGNIPLSVQAV